MRSVEPDNDSVTIAAGLGWWLSRGNEMRHAKAMEKVHEHYNGSAKVPQIAILQHNRRAIPDSPADSA